MYSNDSLLASKSKMENVLSPPMVALMSSSWMMKGANVSCNDSPKLFWRFVNVKDPL